MDATRNPASSRETPSIRPRLTASLTSPMPSAPPKSRSVDQQHDGRTDARREGAADGQVLAGQQRVEAQEHDHQRERDERQRDDVGQQLLVEVGGGKHHQRAEVDAQDHPVLRLGPAPARSSASVTRARQHDRERPPVDAPDGAVRVRRPARREPVGAKAETGRRTAHGPEPGPGRRSRRRGGAVSAAHAPPSASSTSVAWLTPVAPRAAHGCALRK